MINSITFHYRFAYVFLLLFGSIGNSFAQSGGNSAYNFLNLTALPRVAALGGKVAALDESDGAVIFNNPAHLTSELHNRLSLSYVSYFADIKYGYASYTRSIGRYGNAGIGLQHVSYGNFIAADETGLIDGAFSGYEMAIYANYAYTFDSLITVGVAIKPVFSHLEEYRSSGICADLGISYTSCNHLFSAGIAARNIGSMVKPFTPRNFEPMPFELIAGVSQKLKHAPFRFVVTFHQLQNLNLYYEREKETSTFFGSESEEKKPVLERYGSEFLSHLIVGVEFTPVKNFYVRGGYNYQRRNELKIVEKASAVGFSWGLGIKVNRFVINYSRAMYHLAGASNHFSLSTNLTDFFSPSKL